MRILLFLLPVILMVHCHRPQTSANDASANGFVTTFMEISAEAQTINYSNPLEVNNEGGHLQGVQLMQKGGEEYAVLSGSSNTYSYYAIAKLNEQKEVVEIHKILDKPYKHAGGFQIYKGLMAVGVEDNDAKDRSKVFVYRIDDPESAPKTPLAVIEREGAVKRATAGCVGLTQLNNELLLVVGDWDSKHLDFYSAPYPSQNIPSLSFKKTGTIDTEQVDKSTWSDQTWLSYQNINLVKDDQENIYLIGMTCNANDQDIADLYLLNVGSPQSFQLKKLASINLGMQKKTKFRWGAGMFQDADGKMKIISCGENLREEAFITVY